MTFSKLEAMAIYVVNQAYGNDIMPAVYNMSYTYQKECMYLAFFIMG